MKKAISICMMLVFMLMLSSTAAFAQSIEAEEITKQETKITSNTIVTDKNYYEVIDYLGLDKDDVLPNGPSYFPALIDGKPITVGLLEGKVMDWDKSAEKEYNTYYVSSDKIIADDDISQRSSAEIVYESISKHVMDEEETLYYTIKFTGVGDAEISPTPLWKSYWISSITGDVTQGTAAGSWYEHKITKNSPVDHSVINPNTQNSYLKVSCDYTVNTYFLTIPVATQDFNDTVLFDSSYLPNG